MDELPFVSFDHLVSEGRRVAGISNPVPVLLSEASRSIFLTLPVGAEQRHQMWRDALAEIVDVGFPHDPLLDEAETEIKQTGALIIRGDVEP